MKNTHVIVNTADSNKTFPVFTDNIEDFMKTLKRDLDSINEFVNFSSSVDRIPKNGPVPSHLEEMAEKFLKHGIAIDNIKSGEPAKFIDFEYMVKNRASRHHFAYLSMEDYIEFVKGGEGLISSDRRLIYILREKKQEIIDEDFYETPF